LSAQGEKVIIFGMVIGLLGFLSLGFAAVGAPVSALMLTALLILVCLVAVRRDLLHVRRHGWGDGRGADGPNGQSRHGPREPTPPGPSGDGEQFDWDAFVTQFWEHVDREPVA
jgi:hypothetical protein